MLNEISKMTSIKKQSRIEYYKIILETAVEAGTASSYNQDTEWEGRVADCIIPIKQGKLEIAAIKTWWMQFKDQTNYHLLVNNCCTVIFEALTKGGATKYYSILCNIVSTPTTLKLYALKLQQFTQ
jgi:hypothetical protein